MSARERDQVVSFDAARKGYDREQVDRFIEQLHAEYGRELAEANRKIAELEELVAEFKEREEAIHLTLVAATKTKEQMIAAAQEKLDEATAEADKIRSQAQFEAFRLVTEARQDADQLIADAQAEADKLRASLGDADAVMALDAARARVA